MRKMETQKNRKPLDINFLYYAFDDHFFGIFNWKYFRCLFADFDSDSLIRNQNSFKLKNNLV